MAFDRKVLRERIRKLMAMTTAAGCTEAEAMNAAEALRRLLDEHGLDAANLDGLMVEEERVDLGRSRRNQLDRLWSTIAWYCDCTSFTSHGIGSIKVVYAGLEPRPMIARYLHELCENAAAFEVRRYKRSDAYKRRRTIKTKRLAIAAFLEGFALGVARKLLDMKGDNADSGRIIAIASAEIERRYQLTAARAITPVKSKFDDAKADGHIAGKNTAISDGVGRAGGPVALIGSD